MDEMIKTNTKTIFSEIKKGDAKYIAELIVHRLIPFCRKLDNRKALQYAFIEYASHKGEIAATRQVLMYVAKKSEQKYVALSDKNVSLFTEAVKMHLGMHYKTYKITKSVRREVYERYGYECVICGVSGQNAKLEVDHIIPKEIVGDTLGLLNLRPLCKDCNQEKGTHCLW